MRGRTSAKEADEERLPRPGRTAASRWEEGVADEAELEKVCMRGFARLAMEGWGVGRWVVVRVRDWRRRIVSMLLICFGEREKRD